MNLEQTSQIIRKVTSYKIATEKTKNLYLFTEKFQLRLIIQSYPERNNNVAFYQILMHWKLCRRGNPH